MSAKALDGVERRVPLAHGARVGARRPLALWFVTLVSLVPAVWLLPEAWRHLRADLSAGPARVHITRGSAPVPLNSEEDWQMAFARLERAAALTGDDPTSHAEMGLLYSAASQRFDLSESRQLENAALAVTHLVLATSLRPADPRGWADLARARLLTRDAGPAYVQAWELAATLGPMESAVQSQLFETTLATYPDPHTPTMAEWARNLYANAQPSKRRAMERVAATFDVTLGEQGDYFPTPGLVDTVNRSEK